MLFFTSHAHSSQIEKINAGELLAKLDTTTACSTPELAILCRQFPRELSHLEGLYTVNNFLVVLLGPKAPAESQVALWEGKFPLDKKLEYIAYFSLATPDFVKALGNTSYSGALVAILTPGEGSERKIASLSYFEVFKLRDEVVAQHEEVRAEIESALGPWIPSEKLTLSYEFKLVTPLNL